MPKLNLKLMIMLYHNQLLYAVYALFPSIYLIDIYSWDVCLFVGDVKQEQIFIMMAKKQYDEQGDQD
jgi:carbohydrate-binding DOMON domain-containing protein